MTGRLRGGVVTALSRVVTQGAQFATFMVAAASMGPEDFGLYALVSAVIVILTALAGSGWPEYAMQWAGGLDQQRRVLALSILSGGAIALAALVLSLAVPLITSIPEAVPLMRLFAVTILLYSVANVFNGVLIWQHRLSIAAWGIIVSECVCMIVSITLLYAQYGVFALAFGKIAGCSVWMVLGLIETRLLPDFRLPRAAVSEIGRFAANIMSVRMLIALRAYSGTFLVGFFLGAGEAGFFRAAQRLAAAVAEVISEPTRVLSWSLFREMRDGERGTAGFQALANHILPLVLALSLPLFSTLALAGEDLVVGLLGENWQLAGPVLTALAVAGGVFAFGGTVEPILSLAGAVREMPRMVLANLITGTVLTLAAGPFGLLPMAWMQVVAGVLIVLWNARILRLQARVELGQVLLRARWQLLALLVSVTAALLLLRLPLFHDLHPLLRFAAFGLVNVSVFFTTLLMVDNSFRKTIRGAIARS